MAHYLLYDKDVPTTVDIESLPKNGLNLLKNSVKTHLHLPFINYFGSSLTMGLIDTYSDALACFFCDMGIVKGDRVAVFMQNVPQFVISLFGIWKVGAIQVNINPMSKEKELVYILKDSGAKALICMEELYESVVKHISPPSLIITTSPLEFLSPEAIQMVSKIFPNFRKFPISNKSTQTISEFTQILQKYQNQKPAVIDITPDDVALLTYTSGTTGTPKGAKNTHRNIVFNSCTCPKWSRATSEDMGLMVAPLFHITGLIMTTASIVVPSPIVLCYRFDSTLVGQLITKYQVTIMVGAITVYTALLNDPKVTKSHLSSIRALYSGGAPIAPATVEKFHSKFGHVILPTYGLTETTGGTHSTPMSRVGVVDDATGAITVGVPTVGVESWIVNDQRMPLPVGEIGEIAIRGPMVIPGYWGRPEETKKAFGEDGTLYTGDVGFQNKEGWFFIVDRKKDLIIASGYKIWPKEVEDCLYEHDAVNECAVVGVPDQYRGETVKAYVSLRKGYSITPKELMEFCKKKISSYKVPKEIEIVEEIPKTLSGKILRRVLRDAAASAKL